MTNMAPIKKSLFNCSPKNSDPKIIPNIGAKKAKLAIGVPFLLEVADLLKQINTIL